MPTLEIVLTGYGETRQDVAEVCSDILPWNIPVIEAVLRDSLVVNSPNADFATVGGIFIEMGESMPPANFWWYLRRTGNFVTATYSFSGRPEQYLFYPITPSLDVQEIINSSVVPAFLEYIQTHSTEV